MLNRKGEGKKLLEVAVNKLGLSASVHSRVLKSADLADLEGSFMADSCRGLIGETARELHMGQISWTFTFACWMWRRIQGVRSLYAFNLFAPAFCRIVVLAVRVGVCHFLDFPVKDNLCLPKKFVLGDRLMKEKVCSC